MNKLSKNLNRMNDEDVLRIFFFFRSILANGDQFYGILGGSSVSLEAFGLVTVVWRFSENSYKM